MTLYVFAVLNLLFPELKREDVGSLPGNKEDRDVGSMITSVISNRVLETKKGLWGDG